jgi:1-acyl-sn-glycerol-3-phosphate acyltransferase
MVALRTTFGKPVIATRYRSRKTEYMEAMGDGRINRAIEQGRARTSEFKERVPEFKERVPELRERMPELGDELRTRSAELRTRSAELRARGGELARQYRKMDVSWARCGYARAAREALLSGVLGPLMDLYTRKTTVGRDLFAESVDPPVVFVANHSSHLDTPAILRAMPRKWRSRTVVAAAADYFYKQRWSAWAVALLINTVPLGRTGGGLSDGATDHVDRLIDQRWNLLMFPEGTRSRDGSIGKVRSGAAVIAANHGVDIVPIYVSGTHDAMPPGQNWPKRRPGKLVPRRHKIEVRFGAPIAPRDPAQRRDVMAEVQAFWERKGLPEDGRDPSEIHDVLLIHEVLRVHEAAAARERTGRFDKVIPLAPETVSDQPSPAA